MPKYKGMTYKKHRTVKIENYPTLFKKHEGMPEL
jgi:hypothetical protein